jgi:xanthine dehydrogenase YagR molybdenum-binding subunit
VVAETYEAARAAAQRVKLDVRETKPSASFGDEGLRTRPLTEVNPRHKDPGVGDFDAAYAAAPVKMEAEYLTPIQHHNPIELFSTTCVWEGDRLTIHEPSAGVNMLKHGVATQLGVKPETIQVVSPYVGGSFGSKVSVTPRTVLTALVAKDLGRPVRCVLTREQGFTNGTHRAETRHKIRLACTADGKLTAYGHEGWEVTSRTDVYTVNGTENSVHMYAAPNITTRVHAVEADRNTPGFMRSPPEVPYIYALEVAMDEMAEKLGMDPVRFRQINDAQVSPMGKAYTSRSLNQCLDRGAAAFGWSKRDPRPGSMRDGDWLIGYGVAMATYPTALCATAVRVQVKPDGSALVEVAAHDIGTGAYGVAALTAAQELGLDIKAIRVSMGDSDLPPGPVAGGSNTTASVCNAIAVACARIREKLDVPAGASITTKLKGGAVEERIDWFPAGGPPSSAERRCSTRRPGVLGRRGRRQAALRLRGRVRRGPRQRAHQGDSRSPHHRRLRRGRIMNERTARSQLLGGMIWGIGSALHEYTEIDRRTAKYVNDNIAEYLIPVNADIPAVEIIMIPEEDRETNPLGIKGIGELANVGTPAAIANAVYHATGKRIRDLPIRIEDLLET